LIATVATFSGFATGTAALYGGMALIINQVFGRSVLPGGPAR
jgi:succinate-acetate transporter protein